MNNVQRFVPLNRILILTTIVFVVALVCLGGFISNVISLGVIVGILFITFYLANLKNSFWYYLFIIPFIPQYFAFSLSDNLPLLSAYRIFFIIFILDQLLLKRRIPELVDTIKNDRFSWLVFIYSAAILFLGLFQFIKYSDTTAFVGSLSILLENSLLYFIILMNIRIITEEHGGFNNVLRKILNIFSFSTFVLAILGIIEHFISFNVFTLLDISNRAGVGAITHMRMGELRVSTSFIHSLGYGLYLLLMIPLVFYQIKLYKDEKGWKYNFNIALLFLLFINILFTNSRSTLLALVFSMFIYFLFMNFRRKIITLLLIFALGVPVVALSLTPFADKVPILSSVSENVKSLSDTLLGTSYVKDYGANAEPFTYRKELIRFAFSQIGDDNVYGKGIGFIRKEPLVFNLPELNPYGPTISYSVDNYYVNVKLELGWIGLIATLLLIITFVFSIFKNRKEKSLYIIILVAFSGYLFGLTMVGELDTIKYLWIIFAIFSASLSAKLLSNQNNISPNHNNEMK